MCVFKNWLLLTKEKLAFSNRVFLDTQTTPKDRLAAQQWYFWRFGGILLLFCFFHNFAYVVWFCFNGFFFVCTNVSACVSCTFFPPLSLLFLLCYCDLSVFNLILLSLFLDVCLYSNGKEKDLDLGGWAGEEVRRIWEELREGKLIRIYCIKNVFNKKWHDFNIWHSLLICFKSSKIYFKMRIK